MRYYIIKRQHWANQMARTTTVLDLTSSEYSAQAEYKPQKQVQEPEFIQDPRRLVDPTLDEASELPAGVELAFKKTLHGAFKNVDPARVGTHADLIAQLTLAIPLNEYELPPFVYRADMLDMAYVLDTIRAYLGQKNPSTTSTSSFPARSAGPEEMQALQQHLDAATVALNYSEGYPQLGNGQPFWAKLEFESNEAYAMFLDYVALEGIRQLESLRSYNPRDCRENYALHFWYFRAKAFDLFKVADHQRKRLTRMLKSEDDHYTKAEAILKKVVGYLDAVDLEDEASSMDPSKAVAMMEKLVKISRISIGLPANGESKESAGRRTISPTRVLIDEINQAGSRKAESAEDGFDLLLDEDDDLVDMAQDLIIRRQQLSQDNRK